MRNRELIKEVCNNCTEKIEKQAFNISTAVNFLKGPALNAAKNFMKSDIGKNALIGAGLGAATGFAMPSKKTMPDGSVVQENRFKSALKNGLLIGAGLGVGTAVTNYGSKLIDNFKNNINVQASEIIDQYFFEKIAAESNELSDSINPLRYTKKDKEKMINIPGTSFWIEYKLKNKN